MSARGSGLAAVLTLALAATGCGDSGKSPPARTLDAKALAVSHARMLDAGNLQEAARLHEALQELALGPAGTPADRLALAAAWTERIRRGLAHDSLDWVEQALTANEELASRPDATLDLLREVAEGVVEAHGAAWARGDLDKGAELLHGVERLTERAGDDAAMRGLRARAWADAFHAGLRYGDDSLAERAMVRLDELASAKTSSLEERHAYLEALEQGHNVVLATDLVKEAAALRNRVSLVAQREHATPEERAVLVRMEAEGAVHQADRNREEADVLLEAAERHAAALKLKPRAQAALGFWLAARRYLVHRARRRSEEAEAVLQELRRATADSEAPSEAVRACALAVATSLRDATTPEARKQGLQEAHRLAMHARSTSAVLQRYGLAFRNAVTAARASGAEAEADAYVEEIKKGAEQASDPKVREVLAEIVAGLESGQDNDFADLPR